MEGEGRHGRGGRKREGGGGKQQSRRSGNGCELFKLRISIICLSNQPGLQVLTVIRGKKLLF